MLPLSTIEDAFGFSQSSMKVNSWSNTLSRYTRPATPNFSGDKSSMSDTNLAPVAFSILSISDFLTLL